jgi:hypothetical protein
MCWIFRALKDSIHRANRLLFSVACLDQAQIP